MALDPSLTGVIGTIAGTLAGGLLTYINSGAQFRREKHWEHKALIRGKLEELHGAVEQVRLTFLTNVFVIQGHIQNKTFTKEAADEVKNVTNDLAAIRLLVNFYAPHLRARSKMLEECHRSFAACSGLLLQQATHGTLIDHLTKLAADFEETCVAIQEELGAMAQRYAAKP